MLSVGVRRLITVDASPIVTVVQLPGKAFRHSISKRDAVLVRQGLAQAEDVRSFLPGDLRVLIQEVAVERGDVRYARIACIDGQMSQQWSLDLKREGTVLAAFT